MLREDTDVQAGNAPSDFRAQCLSCTVSAASAEIRQVRWSELGELVQGKIVEVQVGNGALLKGRIQNLDRDSLEMRVKRTPDEQRFLKGPLVLPREAVSGVRYTARRGPWKWIGAAAGGAAGVPAAYAVSERTGGQNIARGLYTFVALSIAGVVAGYFLGRAADRRPVTLELIPPESGAPASPEAARRETALE